VDADELAHITATLLRAVAEAKARAQVQGIAHGLVADRITDLP
jgi:hypothetical protein